MLELKESRARNPSTLAQPGLLYVGVPVLKDLRVTLHSYNFDSAYIVTDKGFSINDPSSQSRLDSDIHY